MDPCSFGDAGNAEAHLLKETFSKMRKVVGGAASTLRWTPLMHQCFALKKCLDR